MRKISANYIFPVDKPPVKNGIVIVDDSGLILDVIDKGGEVIETEYLEHYNGVLVPGFVNCHCHLELAHLKNCLPAGIGLNQFIVSISDFRDRDEHLVLKAIQNDDFWLFSGGVVAIGDISNTTLSLETKKNSKIVYHTFIELFGIQSSQSQERLRKGKELMQKFTDAGLSVNLSPHAPYSLNPQLLKGIADESKGKIISLHNQESAEENKLFISGTGKIRESLENLGLDYSEWVSTGTTSLQSVLSFFKDNSRVLLIHNIYTTEQDLEFIKLNENKWGTDIYFTFCPSSNLFIEKQLPDFKLFNQFSEKITLGTDSRASNPAMDFLTEMKLLTLHSSFSFSEILQFGTLNGARAFDFDSWAGSFTKGKKPGINLLTNFDFSAMKLSNETKLKKII